MPFKSVTNFFVNNGHSVQLQHNTFTGTKRVFVDGELAVTTPRVMLEKENETFFQVEQREYALKTVPKLSGAFEYSLTERGSEGDMGENLLGGGAASSSGYNQII